MSASVETVEAHAVAGTVSLLLLRCLVGRGLCGVTVNGHNTTVEAAR